jgi:hypothetical protein
MHLLIATLLMHVFMEQPIDVCPTGAAVAAGLLQLLIYCTAGLSAAQLLHPTSPLDSGILTVDSGED